MFSEETPVCAPNEHTTGPQLSDGTFPETCTRCGINLADSDLEEEYLWQLRLDAAEDAC